MTFERIIADYFQPAAEPGAGALYERLHAACGKLIGDLPHRSEFPAERELAAALGINRNTLRRALAPYVESGILQRSNKGTFVHKPESAAAEPALPPPVHPFWKNAFSVTPLATPRKLTIVLYENLPQQIEFWRRSFDEFEALHGISVDAHWVNVACATQAEYRRMIRDKEADVFQVMEASVDIDEAMRGELIRPPEDVRSLLGTSDYIAPTFFELEDTAWQWTTPFYFSPWVDVVNLELAERYGLDTATVAKGYSLNRILADAAERIPGNIRISSHIGGLQLANGFPVEMTPERLRRHFRCWLNSIQDLRRRGESALQLRLDDNFDWEAPDSIAAFCTGKLLHMAIPSGFVRHWQPYWHFPVQIALSGYESESHLPRNGFSLGIHRNCLHQETAEEFLRFMLAEATQRQLAGLTGVIPMHRRAAEDFLPELDTTPEHREFILARTREFSQQHRLWFWSGYNIGPILRQLMEGRCTFDHCLDAILRLQHKTVQQVTDRIRETKEVFA